MDDSEHNDLVQEIKYESLSPRKEKMNIRIGTAGLIAESRINRLNRRGIKNGSIAQGHGLRRRQDRRMTKKLSVLH